MAATENNLCLRRVKWALPRCTPLAGALSVWITFLASPAAAVDWLFTPTLGTSAILTDNASQTATNEVNSFMLSVTPGFSLQSEGSRRIQFGMRYGLTGITRTGEGQSDNLYNSLNASGKAELMEDFLYIDASASISRQLISLLGSQADATINDTNRATTGVYSISPYIKQRFGNFADAELRYSATGSIFKGNAAQDIYANTLSADLNSGNQFNSLFWGLNFFLRDASAQGVGGADSRFEHYGTTLGYRLTKHLQAIGTLGYDSNQYTVASGAKTSGSSWSLGMNWAPNRRTDLGASFGESFFGRTYAFNLNYRANHSVWSASYKDGVNDIAQQLLNTQPVTSWDCNGQPFFVTGVLQPPGQTNCEQTGLAPIGSVPVGLSNGIFLSKTFNLAAAWTKGRSSLGLSAFDTIRQYQQVKGLPEDETRGMSANYSYRLQPLTTLNTGLAFTYYQSAAGLGAVVARDSKHYNVNLGVNHQFGSSLSGVLVYQHQWQDSNNPASEYAVNIITATANISF